MKRCSVDPWSSGSGWVCVCVCFHLRMTLTWAVVQIRLRSAQDQDFCSASRVSWEGKTVNYFMTIKHIYPQIIITVMHTDEYRHIKYLWAKCQFLCILCLIVMMVIEMVLKISFHYYFVLSVKSNTFWETGSTGSEVVCLLMDGHPQLRFCLMCSVIFHCVISVWQLHVHQSSCCSKYLFKITHRVIKRTLPRLYRTHLFLNYATCFYHRFWRLWFNLSLFKTSFLFPNNSRFQSLLWKAIIYFNMYTSHSSWY